jgi:hypothetical protein
VGINAHKPTLIRVADSGRGSDAFARRALWADGLGKSREYPISDQKNIDDPLKRL